MGFRSHLGLVWATLILVRFTSLVQMLHLQTTAFVRCLMCNSKIRWLGVGGNCYQQHSLHDLLSQPIKYQFNLILMRYADVRILLAMKTKICGFSSTNWTNLSSAWLGRRVSSHVKVGWPDTHRRDSCRHGRVTSQMVDVAGVRLVMADVAQVIPGMVDVAQETMTKLETCQDWLT